MNPAILSSAHSNYFPYGTSGTVYGYDGTIVVNGTTGNLVNGHGTVVQLRGANIQGTAEYMIVAAQTIASTGVNDSTAGSLVQDQVTTVTGSGAATAISSIGSNTAYMQPWKFNCIRIGINEASWLGYTCYEEGGTAVNPNNYGSFPLLSYQNQIDALIASYNAIGCYVILTLAWTNPGRSCPLNQDIMANQDNSIQCWQSLAARYGYPNGTALKRNGGTIDNRSVIFEMFNEPKTDDQQCYQGGFVNLYYQYNSGNAVYPFPCNTPTGTFTPGEAVTISGGITGNVLCYYLNTTTGYASSGTKFIHLYNLSSTALGSGATITGNTSGASTTITSTTYGWYFAGAVQLVGAVRAAGAGNVCLFSGSNYAKYLNNWLTYGAGTDTTAPTGWTGGTWTSQIGAHWHPYPAVSNISAVTVANGGSGYAVNDTVLLLMDESGDTYSGNCYYQTQLKVTSIGTGGAITGVSINTAYVGGTPGVAGGGNGQYGFNGGVWCNVYRPAVVPADTAGAQPGTSGTGATFNVTYTDDSASGGADLADWPTALAVKTAGYPLVITETGEHTGTGIVGSPYMAALTAWADTNGVSIVAFAYTPSTNTSWYNSLGYDFGLTMIPNTVTGSPPHRPPSPGYGQFMFNWFSGHAP